MYNCPHTSGKCPGLVKNEKLIILLKAELPWLLCWFGQLIELIYPNCDFVFLNYYTEKNTAFAKETQSRTLQLRTRKSVFCNILLQKFLTLVLWGLWSKTWEMTTWAWNIIHHISLDQNHHFATTFLVALKWKANEGCS